MRPAAPLASRSSPSTESAHAHLVIGNKNYSSWSMRPWVLMKQAGIPFQEEKLRFDAFNDPDRASRNRC